MWEPTSEGCKKDIFEKLRYTISSKKFAEVQELFDDYERIVKHETTEKLEEQIMKECSAGCYFEVLNIMSEEASNILKLDKEELEKHLKDKTLITYLESKQGELALFGTIINHVIGAETFQKIINESMMTDTLEFSDARKVINDVHRLAYKGFFKKLDAEIKENSDKYSPLYPIINPKDGNRGKETRSYRC